MQYSKFTILKVFIRTADVFSLQFHSYHNKNNKVCVVKYGSHQLKLINTHFFYISKLGAKASGINLGKTLSNLLSNREALN